MEHFNLNKGHSREFVPKRFNRLRVRAGAVAYANGEDYGVAKRQHTLNPDEPVMVVGLATSSLVSLDNEPED